MTNKLSPETLRIDLGLELEEPLTHYFHSQEFFDNASWERKPVKIIEVTEEMMQPYPFKIEPCTADITDREPFPPDYYHNECKINRYQGSK